LRPLVEDFYRPPSESQLLIQGATVAVYNGTSNADWDRVAAERLQWEGFSGYAAGAAEQGTVEQTMMIDYTGQDKGSSRDEIAAVLNIRPENIVYEPDPNRTSDFAVVLGPDYNSCDVQGVLEVGG
ncbi:MAG: LytR C-terminal domain-containing protein, partial [Chloroflexota bacterium]